MPGRAALAAALVLGTASGAVHAPVATGQEAPAVRADDVSGLIRAVADATARLDATNEEIAVKRDEVNKTFVDLQMARVELDRAIDVADRTVTERESAEGDVESARGTLEDYSRLLYRQGTAPGAASSILDPGGPADAGQRQEYLRRAAADQGVVVDDMVAAADEATRREVEATRARGDAERRYSDATARRDDAQTQVSEVSEQIGALEAEVSELNGALEQKELELESSRTQPDGPHADTPEPASVDEDEARAQAERALAENPESQRQAADIASALPAHLDLGDLRQFTGGSSEQVRESVGGTIDAGSVGDALGGAVDTGSAGGALDAGSVDDAVSAGIRGDQDAIIQQVVDAIGRADLGSLQQGPGAPGPGGGIGGGDTGTPSDSARVETVVNRALSQLGVPYAWGGGDANGPTRGIRDGGVADQHGDYNKIGFDCSGLMIYAFAGVGKALPHYTGYQYTAGPQHPVSQRKRGDMLFWPGHVALYLGDGLMVEAPQSGDVVKISPVRMAGMSPMVVRLV